ncbi:prepilin-type N-terminal cleavage/methylation domain-containing protein [Glaciecola sp. MH2013]|uniref:prepilin-type N-terminal cleavage/methylation domain-containing protein n=1 Tax=Glaciecola sp. MH2013 TaxID=2785524 RepID=UPI00189F37CA|nr:prepilin-type N-terminal cleavage/methylation domain-containing protein [Glaciecola sp. MH2013]MBF7073016.1 prepilin-type N-terminal cleavage/methylation domain-containing protein [Glaciecola sp. MH2013]
MLNSKGFTLIELIIVIVILSLLALVALPRFLSFGSDARISSLNGIAAQLRATTQLVQAKARVQGLRASTVNPGGLQDNFLVDFGYASAEVMFSNLCPESIAENGDRLRLLDFVNTSFTDDISTRVDNRYTLIGYDVPSTGVPLNQGCYILYDSFATPNCTIELVTDDC